MRQLLLTAVLVTTLCLLVSTSASAGQGPPGSISATMSGSGVLAGIDLNGDGQAGAFHLQGSGSGTHGQFDWSSLSEANPNFAFNTPRCPGLLDANYDAMAVVIRHKQGDLLYLRLEPGDVSYGCVDPVTFANNAVSELSVVGGTDRFFGATGTALVEISADIVLFDAFGRYVFGGGVGTMLIEFD